MARIKGPGIFLAQFLRDEAPYDALQSIAVWVKGLGYNGVQIPTWDARVIDLDRAAESKGYCDELLGGLGEIGLEVTELSAHLQGQVLAMHPAYETGFEPFYPKGLDAKARTEWATDQLMKAVQASAHMGLKSVPVLSGGFLWHMVYPWPQRPAGLVEEAFEELHARWRPVLDRAQEDGIAISFELHPGSDLFDGATYERFLDVADDHPAACLLYDPSHFVLQQLDYVAFLELYGERVRSFHVKDAEFHPTGRVGVYGGYEGWVGRAGRFRSLGDGQVDFGRIFSLLAEKSYEGWAVLEWECCLKSPEQGAREGAPFIARHVIETTGVAFDDFAGGQTDVKRNRKMLGLD
jgi:sugar phosphate isomerase/epimerase